MELVPFRNYSDALVPLPSLGAGAPDRATTPLPGNASFRETLEGMLDRQAAGPDRPSAPPDWLFDLSADRPHAPPAVGQAGIPLPPSSPYAGFSRAVLAREETAALDTSDGIMQACRDIEGFLLGLLLKNLWNSLGGSNLFSRTWESSVYRDMFFNELARSIGGSGPALGIAEVLHGDIMLRAGTET